MTDDNEIRVTSVTGGQKNSKESRYDLIPVVPLDYLARVFGRGSLKYEDRNWERGYSWHLSYAAMMRHANAFWRGEDLDSHNEFCPNGCVEHTGLPHLAQVMWHAAVLLEFTDTHPEFDCRVKR